MLVSLSKRSFLHRNNHRLFFLELGASFPESKILEHLLHVGDFRLMSFDQALEILTALSVGLNDLLTDN